MKKFFEQLQSYGEKAGQVKQIIEAAPEKAAQLRDAVFMTTGQLQAMRRDVQATVAGLRAEDDLRLSTALNDIQAGAGEIRKAGYELAGVEMELDPVQRLILLLEKVDDVTEGEMRSLIAANATRKSLHGVLSALMKGEQMADECRLQGMEFCQLRVSLGPIPSVRLIWKSADRHATEEFATSPIQKPAGIPAPPPLPGSSAPAPAAPVTASSSSLLGEGSFFGRRTAGAANVASQPQGHTAEFHGAAASAAVMEAAHPDSDEAPAATPVSKSSASALDRFKKMPNLTTRR